MGKILSDLQLKRLAEHEYSAEGRSLLEPLMQIFWQDIVQRIPLWWAPNALTLSGLVINVVTTLILIIYSPDAIQETPRWAYFLCAIGLFIYQTLDAIDGKQARRTKSSSPLGELFDHGCDCLSIVFVAIGTCISVQLGTIPVLLFIDCFGTVLVFYCAQWQTYCSGIMRFGKIDVTEAQFVVMFGYMVSGIFGQNIWSTMLPVVNFELKIIPAMMAIITSIGISINYFRIIFLNGGVGKNGSTVAGTSVLTPIVPIGIVYTLAIVVWLMSPSRVYETHPVLYILAFCIPCAKITCRLVVAHMTRNEMERLDVCMIGPGLLFVNQYFGVVVDEYIILWLSLIFSSLDLLRFSVLVCRQICSHLGIYCFHITSPRDPPSNKPPTDGVLDGPLDHPQDLRDSAAPLNRRHGPKPQHASGDGVTSHTSG